MHGTLRLSLLEGDIQIKTMDLGGLVLGIHQPAFKRRGMNSGFRNPGDWARVDRGPGVGGKEKGVKAGGSGGPESKTGPMEKPK